MNIFQAAVLGLVQGLAEFLPISSSGHLILARLLMGISDVEAATGKYIIFGVLLHAGNAAGGCGGFLEGLVGDSEESFQVQDAAAADCRIAAGTGGCGA